MSWAFSVFLLLCLSSTTFSQFDDFDCEIPQPAGVEPLSCCQVSKPFDQNNFPGCFASAPPTTTPQIPITEVYDDDADDHDDGDNYPTNGPTDKDDDHKKYWEWKKTKYGYYPSKYNHGYDAHRHYHDYHHDTHGDYHDSHSDYHRPGFYHRYRRQVIYRINTSPSTPPAPALCSIECIFNQTNILANGRFDRNVALQVYSDYYPEVPIDLLTRTIDRCTRQLRNFLVVRRRRSRTPLGRNLPIRRCRNGSGLFAACFNREVYRNCPTELDTDSEDCDSLRTFIDNCSPTRGIQNNFQYDNVDVDPNGDFIPSNN